MVSMHLVKDLKVTPIQRTDKSKVGATIKDNGQVIGVIPLGDARSSVVLSTTNTRGYITVEVKTMGPGERRFGKFLTSGSVSMEKALMVNAAKKKEKAFWITLFDDPSDDVYDGDFTEDDPETPMVNIWFKKTTAQKTKPAPKVEEAPIEHNPAHDVENLKGEVNSKLRELIDTLTEDQQQLFAEEDERIQVLNSLASAHEELKGEHAQDIETSAKLKQSENEIVLQITTK